MTSCSKVIDLKLKVYEQIKQSPADQLIYLSQIALEDSQTLESARVEANNVDNPLILIVQQRMENSTESPDNWRRLQRYCPIHLNMEKLVPHLGIEKFCPIDGFFALLAEKALKIRIFKIVLVGISVCETSLVGIGEI
uniref:Uncharacterized protein n=1 Tax=Ditylenchus dipsaci TaxID=166011 RepID=A0A915E6L8_9BILA